MAIKIRQYANYDEYIAHQKSKAGHGSELYNKLLNELWTSDCHGFQLIFEAHKEAIEKATKAICLGARTGQEVHVLREMGLDTTGMDLVDCPPLVEEGDVHNLKYADASFDFIFSNIFDHVLMPEKFISELERVAKSNAYCILHLSLNDLGDQHSANVLSDVQTVVILFKRKIEIIKNERLNLTDRPDWPGYWELAFRFED
jgi:SAM-dependent methyltransferase